MNLKPQVFLVVLRRPGPKDQRSDPFYEFGSFGCTGCHKNNLLHPVNHRLKDGDRLAFIQGGREGSRMVLLTPPIEVVAFGKQGRPRRIEARWNPKTRPFKYEMAPLVASNSKSKGSAFPKLRDYIESAERSSWSAKLASCFRSSSSPLDVALAAEVIRKSEAARRKTSRSCLTKDYSETMALLIPRASARERWQALQRLRRGLLNVCKTVDTARTGAGSRSPSCRGNAQGGIK